MLDVVKLHSAGNGSSLFSINNRRLYCAKKAAQQAGCFGRVQIRVRVQEVIDGSLFAKILHAWTTRSSGQEVKVRKAAGAYLSRGLS